MIDQEDGDRLRRRLRALSAVNEQLRAQLEATRDEVRTAPRQAMGTDVLDGSGEPVPIGLAPRRAAIAADWLDQLPEADPQVRARLVTTADGACYVVEGSHRRRVRSGLVANAVERLLGERRVVSDHELAAWAEAAPVEVLEAGSGLPFVVVGGKRLSVLGLPLPHPVDQAAADAVGPGPDLDLPAAVTPRRAHEADGWIAACAAVPADRATLVVAPDGTAYVVEGTTRRLVPSSLFVPALEELLGAARPADQSELDGLEPGPAVEVLEASVGEPFVVIAGKRSRVAGYPVPYPVHQDQADALRDGPTIDIARAQRRVRTALGDERNRLANERDRAERKVARVQARLDEANAREARRRANPDPAGELRALIEVRGGVGHVVARSAKKQVRRLVRRVRPTR